MVRNLIPGNQPMETLGVYIQVPFCASKCSFCNFSSRVVPSTVFDAYVRALEREIERLPALYEASGIGLRVLDLPINTVYMGGGTPSLLGIKRLKQIREAVCRRFKFGASLEFTLEVTPGSADEPFLSGALALGVNRLSVGAQAFNDRELRSVGRLHSAAKTQELVRQARRAGFANISLDLIAGLPHQTATSWLSSLRTAAGLKPEHVSVYLFEVDEKSRLGGEVLRRGNRYHAEAAPGDDFMAAAYETAREFLTAEGYLQYEISNFALSGRESRHNQKYWRLEPYIGLGPGAHSFDGRQRWANEVSAEVYAEKLKHGDSPMAEVHSISADEQVEEFFFLGLRQREGVDLSVARQRWGHSRVSNREATISSLSRRGWLERSAQRIRLTPPALLVSNEIFAEFLT